ncbi:MAG: formylglycine-generating enzyme family protein [Kiritimatiellae bacterium]|nr:formylglycine-generating enzyme family protein [Kiritimatiellia bacterium]
MRLLAATPAVSGVAMSQNPATREVTITYKLSSVPAIVTFDIETNGSGAAASSWSSIGGEGLRNVSGDAFVEITESRQTYAIRWNPDRSFPGPLAASARAVVTAHDVGDPPDYMVVPLYPSATGGTALPGVRYYPSAAHLPGGVGADRYKTSHLVMRRVRAKNVVFRMGSTGEGSSNQNEALHNASLSSDYFIGVYPITQKQWQRVKGNTPSYWSVQGAMRPVENVSYNDVRTSDNNSWSSTYEYPNRPHGQSFLGRLNALTGDALGFDLPSEAQWEYVARAGNGVGHLGRADTGITRAEAKTVGRMAYNGGQLTPSYTEPPATVGPENATAIVGSYLPNDWGVYDMLGNVGEWCLDWYQADISGLNGAPNMTASGTKVVRGAMYGCQTGESGMRPAYRSYSRAAVMRERYTGVRVVCTGRISP